LYTRNCYPDVPAAQFAWSATPCVTFCLKYYYHYRNDSQRRELADLAYKLARNMTYRYLAIWPCDNDESDDLNAAFFMEPNAGLPWLGCACANEIWVYNIAMLYEYLSTGDPIMGHYLRGMLERYHEMFQDQYYPTVQQYPSDAFTERFGLYDECAQGRGKRATFGGLWGGLERWIWPIGTASAHVTCGEKAAMAFDQGGRHTDIADYRYSGDGNFSFKLVPGGLQADPQATLDVAVSFPFFSLLDKPVVVTRGDRIVTASAEQVVRFPAEAATIVVKGLKLGDIVAIGPQRDNAPVLSCAVIKPRTPPSEDKGFIEANGFRILNLARGAFGGVDRDWDNLQSMAGYEPGLKTIHGVPFLLLDPEATGNKVCVPEMGVAVADTPWHLFALVGDVTDKSRLVIVRDGDRKERVDLSRAVPVVKGWPPIFEWHLDLIAVDNAGKMIQSIAPENCKLYALTSTARPAQELAPTLAAIGQRRAEIIAEQQMTKALAELRPLFEAASGHIAILPSPNVKNPRGSWLMRLFSRAGLAKHVTVLSRDDLINPFVLNRRDIWLAFYVGSEDYYQTINRPGDGDEALRNWLKQGGTLVSLASGPFPFYYNEKDKPVVSAPKFGLPVCGSGAGNRADTLDVANVGGWEKTPADLQLSFRVNPNQQVLTGLPATIPWSKDADPRWRPLVNVVGKENEYTPLITLRDQTGKSHGDAVAMIQYRTGGLAGARVVYVWHSMRADRQLEQTLVTGLLKYLLSTVEPVRRSAGILPAAVSFKAVANGSLPPGWSVTDGDWAVQDGALVGRNSGTDGWAPSGIVTGSRDWTDVRLTLRFQVRQYGSDHRDGAWIGFRYTGSGECYCLALQHGGVMLHKLHQGASTGDNVQLATAQWTRDTAWHDLAISVKGKHIEVELDGKRLIAVDDNDLLGVGPVPSGGVCLS
ncbi:MAG: DUF1080 domain-containing protein, partial [Armatimonadetes bacterium]|nr:DUF1080 domain-containing protein [Armatimonadota bacterium]